MFPITFFAIILAALTEAFPQAGITIVGQKLSKLRERFPDNEIIQLPAGKIRLSKYYKFLPAIWDKDFDLVVLGYKSVPPPLDFANVERFAFLCGLMDVWGFVALNRIATYKSTIPARVILYATSFYNQLLESLPEAL